MTKNPEADSYKVSAEYEPQSDAIFVCIRPAIDGGFTQEIGKAVEVPDGVGELRSRSTYLDKEDDFKPYTELDFPVKNSQTGGDDARNIATQIAEIIAGRIQGGPHEQTGGQ